MRSKTEIAAEVERLKKMEVSEPVRARVNLAIEELVTGVRNLSLRPPVERELVSEIRRWKLGITEVPPSVGWEVFGRL